MRELRRVCPLCGSVLSAARFAQVVKAHRGMERQLSKLKAAEERAKLQLTRAKENAKRLAQLAKAKATRQVELERKRSADRIKKYQASTGILRLKIQDLERRLKMGETAQSEGLLEERVLLEFLRTHFPEDQYEHVGKRGDILQRVRTSRGAEVGRIVYEVKRVQQWSNAHIVQCAQARVDREADIAVLVTNRFPARRQYYFCERSVLVISPLALLPVVHTARDGLLNVHGLRVSGDQKKRAVEAVYDYLAAGQYMDHVRGVAQHLADIEKLYHREIASHRKTWDDRLKHYRSIAAGVGTIHDRLRVLISPAVRGQRVLSVESQKLLPKFVSAERL